MTNKVKPGASKANTSLTLDDMFHNSADRRSEPRITNQRAIHILPCLAQGKWDFKTVILLDCSPRGLAIRSDMAMHRGEEFLVKVKVQRMTMVIYRVCHCEQLDKWEYKIGAKLVECVGTPDEILKGMMEREETLSPQGP